MEMQKLLSFITEDIVDVRTYPAIDGRQIAQLHKNDEVLIIGASKEIDTIDGYTGVWLKIKAEGLPDDDGLPGFRSDIEQNSSFWVFSKYVADGNITATPLTNAEKDEQGNLRATYIVGTQEKLITIRSLNRGCPNTYIWNFEHPDFYYRSIPGTYIWYPEEKELRHITYLGMDSSAWVSFTDDFTYLLQDFGTGPGVRGLGVWRLSDQKFVFWAGNHGYIQPQGHTIKIVSWSGGWNKSENAWYDTPDNLDDELIAFAKTYTANNPPPEENPHDLSLYFFIWCEVNLDTGERTIVDGEYLFSQ
jgi:hypothetical protein